MVNLDWTRLGLLLVDWCMILRPYSLLLVLGGFVLAIPAMLAGFQRLREVSGGPLGELCVGAGLFLQALTIAAWWGPALLR